MHAAVSLRTFVSTIKIVIARNFDIFTSATAILPACGTQGIAMQPGCRPDEASCKKRAGGCREYSHFIAVNLQLRSTRKDNMANRRTSLSKSLKGLLWVRCQFPMPRFIDKSVV